MEDDLSEGKEGERQGINSHSYRLDSAKNFS